MSFFCCREFRGSGSHPTRCRMSCSFGVSQTYTYHVTSVPLHTRIKTKCVREMTRTGLSYLLASFQCRCCTSLRPKFIMTVFSQAPVFWSLLICWSNESDWELFFSCASSFFSFRTSPVHQFFTRFCFKVTKKQRGLGSSDTPFFS